MLISWDLRVVTSRKYFSFTISTVIMIAHQIGCPTPEAGTLGGAEQCLGQAAE